MKYHKNFSADLLQDLHIIIIIIGRGSDVMGLFMGWQNETLKTEKLEQLS